MRADADQLELLGEALGHAHHHVGDEGAGQAVEALGLTGVIRALHEDLVALALDGEDGLEGARELALGALHRDRLAVDGDIHAIGNGNGHLADT